MTGMCFEQIETDSLFSFGLSTESHATISSISTITWELQICISERLEKVKGAQTITTIKRWEKAGKINVGCAPFLADNLLRKLGEINGICLIVALLCVKIEKKIINFVHKSDGKKRMCIA